MTRTRLALAALLPVLVAPLALPSPAPAVETTDRAAASCYDVAFLGARGSGEPFKNSNLNMGDTVIGAFEEYGAKVKGRTVGGAGTIYPAQEVAVIATDRKMYFSGLDQGVKDTVSDLKRFAKRCPQQRFVLSGYSQGAMVMHRAVWELDKGDFDMSRIDGVILIADGDRWPDKQIKDYGSASDNAFGISYLFPNLAGEKYKPRKSFPSSLAGRIHSICIDKDAVCDTGSFAVLGIPGMAAFGFKNHEKYRPGKSAAGLVKDAAVAVARRTNSVSVLTPVPTPNPPPSPPNNPPSSPPGSTVIGGPGSSLIDISDDGRFIAYRDQVAAGSAHTDLFRWDRATGTSTRITTTTNAETVTGAAVSGDGRILAYSVLPIDPVMSTPTGPPASYVSDLSTGSTTNVTDRLRGSYALSLSADGRYVAFSTSSPDVVPGDTNGQSDIFLWDRTTAAAVRLTDGDNESYGPVVSSDGSTVAFSSRASNLVPGVTDPNPERDIFRWRSGAGAQQLTVDGDNVGVTMSNDGSRIAFGGPGAMVRTWSQASGVVRISLQSDGSASGGEVAPDGGVVAYNHEHFPGDQAMLYLWTPGGGSVPIGAGRSARLANGAGRLAWEGPDGIHTN